MKKLPKKLQEILKLVPIEQGILLLSDYRNGQKTAHEITKKFRAGYYNNRHEA